MKVLIRADASGRIGCGHVMRSLALAQELKEMGVSIVWAARVLNAMSLEAINAESIPIRGISVTCTKSDVTKTVQIAYEEQVDWVVVDSYALGAACQRAVKSAGLRLLLIDDQGDAGSYCADIVVNPDPNGKASRYKKHASHVHFLIGSEYALFRSQFLRLKDRPKFIPGCVRRMLITLGGGDQSALILKMIALWRVERDFCPELIVVSGVGDSMLKEVEADAAKKNIRSVVNVGDMAKLMAETDLALTAGGGTLAELCLLGVPSLTIAIADNQKEFSRRVATAGATVLVGTEDTIKSGDWFIEARRVAGDHALRASLSTRAQKLYDGGGRTRVVHEMLAL